MNPIEITQEIIRTTEALRSDGMLYFSGITTLATAERKNILVTDITTLKSHIEALEQTLA